VRAREAGFTYFELLATVGILLILASAVMPTARMVKTRQKEIELRSSLRTLRNALDEYHRNVVAGRIGGTDVKVGSEGYPPDLGVLVEGVSQVGRLDTKMKFLRRIPIDPMTGKAEWGKKCYQDDADSTSWCGQNVWDVYSLSQAKGLDGTKYNEW
jgi:general secretion pathway protein G